MNYKAIALSIILCAFLFLAAASIESKNLLLPDADKSEYSDSLRVWSSPFSMTGYKYSYLGKKEDVGWGGSKVKRIVQDDPEALKAVNRFGTFHKTSIILYAVSGFTLGWGLGAVIAGKEEDAKPFLIAGGAGFVVAVPLDIIGYKHLKRGVKRFNAYQRGEK